MGLAQPWPDHPGALLRQVGFACEQSARQWRTQCLQSVLAANLDLTLIGDCGWSDQLPALKDLRPPVDYYDGLAQNYAQAACTINLTSLLLPAGLTQRHFDVFCAGGFLLSDNTPGLGIFPQDLVAPIVFNTPAELPDLAAGWLEKPDERLYLIQNWQELLFTEHTYECRIKRMIGEML